MTYAASAADLIVEGRVVGTQTTNRLPISQFAADLGDSYNMECVGLTRATLQVSRIVSEKSADDVEPLAFWFYSPCYAVDPQVMLGVTLPAALDRGDRLRVYLARRDNRWWLIAHEPWYPPIVSVPVEFRRFTLPGPPPPGPPLETPAPGATAAAAPALTAPAAPGGENGAMTAGTPPTPMQPMPSTAQPTPPAAAGAPAAPAPAPAPTAPPPLWQVPAPPGTPGYSPRDRWWPPPKK
jgi:hypothetical protein